ncbi:MAG: acyltransferase family protein [Muribaculaceae bacterium]
MADIPAAPRRNTVISICKGIAIILMVIGHAEAPDLLTRVIYTFHMPLFFITAGYFFTAHTADDPWRFTAKRFKGLYIPFIKWSMIFLLLHNVFFHFGILNETYGNWTGGVTHPYSWKTAGSRLIHIFTDMSGYDEFIAGAFWFFRGLLVASLLFLVLYRLFAAKGRLSHVQCAALICIGAVAFTAFRIAGGYKIYLIPNGGMREIWGLFFFGIGAIYRHYEPRIRENFWLFLFYFALIFGAGYMHFSGMNNSGKFQDLWTLPITGTVGFLMVHYAAKLLDRRRTRLRDLLVFIGDNTLYILVFHVLSYKVVSLIKIWYHGLEWEQMGCHMVIHDFREDGFWIWYSIAGVALPILGILAWRRGLSLGRRLIKSRA